MTLEKLLILGLAIAATTAITISATSINTGQKDTHKGWKDKTTTLIEMTK